jgi:hypothetical protein
LSFVISAFCVAGRLASRTLARWPKPGEVVNTKLPVKET